MEQALLPLSLLTMNTRRWSCQVLLVEKTNHKTSRTTGNNFQMYIFAYSQGTKLQAVSYGQDAKVVDSMLQLLCTYIVSNARMALCHSDYKLVDHDIQWILTTSTAIELVTHNPLPRTLGSPEFTPFTKLEEYKRTDANIDILALAIEKSSMRSITTQHRHATVQDIVLITPEKIPVISLWNDFIESDGAAILPASEFTTAFLVVAALRVRIQSFRGLSLSAKGCANIIANPPHAGADSLMLWASKNEDYLQSILLSRSYFNTSKANVSVPCMTPSTVAAVLSTQIDDHFTVRGQASLKEDLKTFYYMACSGYYKATTATEHTDFTCRYCNRTTGAILSCNQRPWTLAKSIYPSLLIPTSSRSRKGSPLPTTPHGSITH